MSTPSIVLAGGGTAGHTSPLIATAQALKDACPDVKLTCIGTERGLETKVIPAAGLDLELIPAVPMPRRPNADLVKLPVRLSNAMRRSRRILRESGANVVVGYGGYVSTPAYLAARSLRIPVVIHEQNVRPGMANMLGARFAAKVFTTFPATALPGGVRIGLPARKQITELALAEDRDVVRKLARKQFGLPEDGPVLLVSGGSQGAKTLNDATIGALDQLLWKGISVLHVWGPKNYPKDAVIRQHESGARYVPVDYVDNMPDAYAAADFMLARSGAGTVVETAMVGLPAIFVPLAIGNGEQALNAHESVAAGAAVLIANSELSAARLMDEVHVLLGPGRLRKMRKAASALMPADAAKKLAHEILELA